MKNVHKMNVQEFSMKSILMNLAICIILQKFMKKNCCVMCSEEF